MYELTAKSRATKRYITLETFWDERQFHYMLDQVDPERYSEAMIIKWVDKDPFPHCIMYVELERPKIKRRDLNGRNK